jgi:excisionase family DNA binding protein
MTSRTPCDRSLGANDLAHVRGHHRGGSGLPKYYTIQSVAEALDVSPRTVRRWIGNRDLIVHRVGGVLRISDGDLRAFMASHRDC